MLSSRFADLKKEAKTEISGVEVVSDVIIGPNLYVLMFLKKLDASGQSFPRPSAWPRVLNSKRLYPEHLHIFPLSAIPGQLSGDRPLIFKDGAFRDLARQKSLSFSPAEEEIMSLKIPSLYDSLDQSHQLLVEKNEVSEYFLELQKILRSSKEYSYLRSIKKDNKDNTWLLELSSGQLLRVSRIYFSGNPSEFLAFFGRNKEQLSSSFVETLEATKAYSMVHIEQHYLAQLTNHEGPFIIPVSQAQDLGFFMGRAYSEAAAKGTLRQTFHFFYLFSPDLLTEEDLSSRLRQFRRSFKKIFGDHPIQSEFFSLETDVPRSEKFFRDGLIDSWDTLEKSVYFVGPNAPLSSAESSLEGVDRAIFSVERAVAAYQREQEKQSLSAFKLLDAHTASSLPRF